MITNLLKEIQELADPERAKILQGFFKTGKGQYGEGDIFLGITVPEIRKLSKKYENLSQDNLQTLLNSEIHEQRLLALLIMVEQYNKNQEEKIINLYKSNFKNINNWDLIDLTAPKILGKYYFEKDTSYLHKLAKSENLWEKRISILSTFYFIQNNQFEDSLKIAETLLNDAHDLIHKAVGWMLREIGKRNQEIEEQFLKKHYKTMPRTMLRYAIERFDEEKRQAYLKGKI